MAGMAVHEVHDRKPFTAGGTVRGVRGALATAAAIGAKVAAHLPSHE
jgi:hypothetical protein